MKILLTGFEPFGESLFNPSQLLVNAYSPPALAEITISKQILPVDHDKAPKVLMTALQDHQPDAVLSFGLALGRAKISLEKVAINFKDYRIPDNTGITLQDQPIVVDGPTAYFSTLPIRDFLTKLNEADIPAEISLTAGSYLCNQVFYSMMHHIAIKDLPMRAGFVHLPPLPKQAAQSAKPVPSMSLEQDLQGLQIMIDALMEPAIGQNLPAYP
jgi:pyroglutamyl-peptidase